MIGALLKKVLGLSFRFDLKQARATVARIDEIEAGFRSLPEEAFREKTRAWKEGLSTMDDLAALSVRLDELLPEAFALVKAACRRLVGRQITVRGQTLTWDMVPFDVQTIGGMALHGGHIAEMATGEGKTLAATLPAYLNALAGRGVHVVTVNDYLAARDSEWMGALYRFLGLSVGCILQNQPPAVRRQMYACDITYGTNSEFGFDYLRDNGLARTAGEQVQRGRHFAIVDEVDSILLDEARTPLIISGPAVVSVDRALYREYRLGIEALVRHQARLAERFLSEAREALARFDAEEGPAPSERAELERSLGSLLYKIRLGAPKSAGLLKLLEDPRLLRLLSQAELALHADGSKQTLYARKEELFFAIEEKSHEADLTEKGRALLAPGDPEAFVLPDLAAAFAALDRDASLCPGERSERKARLQARAAVSAQRVHVVASLLKAYCLYEKDVDYVIQDGKIVIVDEHTGRLMPGRRWHDGLHQAVEAKEEVEIERETQTLATVTIQNYFRLYHKLAGMTGTAETEAGEFYDIYKLGVASIPTNKPVARRDLPDSVFKTKREKFAAVLREIQEIHRQGRPVLVGTASVETSEHLSRLLGRAGVPHSVLNAKLHQQEAEVVARAGRRGAVTIATNMAGRGTDIKLGEGVAELGGLHVLATERHDARRIDRQLRGRCARQGDPGSSHCFVSMEDDLLRVFGEEGFRRVLEKAPAAEGQGLRHPLLKRSLETTQRRVEQHHFQIRKRTLEYDDVMNKQREVVYELRNRIVHGEDVHGRLLDLLDQAIAHKLNAHSEPDKHPREWDSPGFLEWLRLTFPVGLTEEDLLAEADRAEGPPPLGSLHDGMSPAQYAVAQWVTRAIGKAYEVKTGLESPEALPSIERSVILGAIDLHWQEHLVVMDGLREGIGLRSYGQRDPLVEYQAEAFRSFETLMVEIQLEVCRRMFRTASSQAAFERFLGTLRHGSAGTPGGIAVETHSDSGRLADEREAVAAVRIKPARVAKVGRNDPCPCASGRKFKHCCGG